MSKKDETAKTPEFEGNDGDKVVLRWTWSSRQESYTAKRDRMLLNRMNFDTYNLKGDFSHKKRGQSTEFLPRQKMAVEQIASFMHQAMIDVGDDWWSVEAAPGNKDPKITADEIAALTNRQLQKIDFASTISDGMKLGLLGSLLIMKIHGEWVDKPRYYIRKSKSLVNDKVTTEMWKKKTKVWQLKCDLVRQEDWFPDPTGDGLYQYQQIEMDLFKVKQLSRGANAIYDPDIVDQIVGGFEDAEQVGKKARETGQNQTYHNVRKRVRLWECYGSVLDPTTGELLYENVTWTVANDRYLIRKPTPVSFWHGKPPFIVLALTRGGQPKQVWPPALMDAPTKLNLALNELFNLQLDQGLMATWGIRQIRTNWLIDETQIAEGIAPGATLEVNETCPPGQKVLEPVQTVTMTPETGQTFQVISGEFQQSAMTSDLRMGVLPSRQVKATEVAEASQTMTSMFTGLAKTIETSGLVPALEMIWMTVAQHVNDLDDDEVTALLGKDRALELNGMSNEELFKNTVKGFLFRVFGMSSLLNRQKDFRKITALLQTIAADPAMLEEFTKEYSMAKLLTEVIKSLDIDPKKIELDPTEKAAMAMMPQGGPGATQPGAGPDMQSNIAQAAAGPTNPAAGGPQPAAGVQATHFPPSRAISGIKK